ncbi:MAG TPA: hypothetical protein VHE35_19175 [Kofleriaceae bacterium]|nr:hypothetical protein [Kofleriaceae bacterium]
MASNRFSLAAVFLAYFLVAGGIALALILLVKAGARGDGAFYGAVALGGAVGGAAAARARRGSTIIEPAIGGLLVIGTLVGIFIGTQAGSVLWHVGKDQILRAIAIAGALAAAGAIVGAVAAEKLAGGHSTSPLAWLLFVAFAMLGACLVSTVVAVAFFFHGTSDDSKLGGIVFGAMAVGAFVTGLTTGASAPRRILLVNLVGVVAGVMGYYLLVRALPNAADDKDAGAAALGFAIIGVAGGLVAMAGAAIGWRAVGKRNALDAEVTSRAFA